MNRESMGSSFRIAIERFILPCIRVCVIPLSVGHLWTSCSDIVPMRGRNIIIRKRQMKGQLVGRFETGQTPRVFFSLDREEEIVLFVGGNKVIDGVTAELYA